MNKISEKAVWDELVPSGDENTSSASFVQSAQSQMMFCYKCNQVIPANSAFCPWCQTELFVTCPKCANKYSSQYPSCNQCGTNLEMYMAEILRVQKQKAEDERKSRERELAMKIAVEKDEAEKREIIRIVNEDITKTEEYIEAYNFLLEAKKIYQREQKRDSNFSLLVDICLCIFLIVFWGSIPIMIQLELYPVYVPDPVIWKPWTIIATIVISVSIFIIYCFKGFGQIKMLNEYIPNYSNLQNLKVTANVENLIFGELKRSKLGFGWERLEQWLISSYRNVYGIGLDTAPYEWLSEKPTFLSRHIDFSHWIKDNIKYPSEAKKNRIEGEVVVNYTVNRFGFVENVNIRKSAHPLLDSEVVRVVSESPQWSPGRFKGIAVSVKFQHVYTFKI